MTPSHRNHDSEGLYDIVSKRCPYIGHHRFQEDTQKRCQLHLVRPPSSRPFLGIAMEFLHSSQFLRNPQQAFLDLAERYGDLVECDFGILSERMLLLSHPASIVKIFNRYDERICSRSSECYIKGSGYDAFRSVTPHHLPGLEGRMATNLRRQLLNIFSSHRLEKFSEVMNERWRIFGDWILLHENKSNPSSSMIELEVSEPIRKVALDIISLGVLGVKLDQEDIGMKESLESAALHTIMQEWHNRVVEIFPIRKIFPQLLLPRQRQVQNAKTILFTFLHDVIGNRLEEVVKVEESPLEEEQVYDDVLQDLLVSQIRALKEEEETAGGQQNVQEEKVNVEEISNLVFTLLAMGHENISSSLTWTLALLAQHAPIQEELRQKFLAIRGQKSVAATGNAISWEEDLSQIPLLHYVIQESLRLFPPVSLLSRKKKVLSRDVGRPLQQDEHFMTLPIDEIVISPYVVHRLSRYWSDPHEFKPYRWEALTKTIEKKSDDASPSRIEFISTPTSGSFFPFGLGGRACIAKRLTYMEISMFLYHMLTRYRLELAPDQSMETKVEISLRPAQGMRLCFTPL